MVPILAQKRSASICNLSDSAPVKASSTGKMALQSAPYIFRTALARHFDWKRLRRAVDADELAFRYSKR
jgi:hypothetical protein